MQQTNTNKSCPAMKIGLLLGGAAAAAVVAVNKRSRQTVVSGTKKTVSTVNEASSFLSENREEIITKVKAASNELSHLLQSAAGDIQDIGDRAAHLKDTTLSAKAATERTAREIKELKGEETEQKQLHHADNVEQLPTRDNRS